MKRVDEVTTTDKAILSVVKQDPSANLMQIMAKTGTTPGAAIQSLGMLALRGEVVKTSPITWKAV